MDKGPSKTNSTNVTQWYEEKKEKFQHDGAGEINLILVIYGQIPHGMRFITSNVHNTETK